ncbi:hypothetical protein PG996_010729 [Apiospora saccharicola]|uniref:Uncharacterized protein n=1 Tax=Apiospora saccharicola TaxID=335842 RepID=A0ABR1USH5_9PEZI
MQQLEVVVLWDKYSMWTQGQSFPSAVNPQGSQSSRLTYPALSLDAGSFSTDAIVSGSPSATPHDADEREGESLIWIQEEPQTQISQPVPLESMLEACEEAQEYCERSIYHAAARLLKAKPGLGQEEEKRRLDQRARDRLDQKRFARRKVRSDKYQEKEVTQWKQLEGDLQMRPSGSISFEAVITQAQKDLLIEVGDLRNTDEWIGQPPQTTNLSKGQEDTLRAWRLEQAEGRARDFQLYMSLYNNWRDGEPVETERLIKEVEDDEDADDDDEDEDIYGV